MQLKISLQPLKNEFAKKEAIFKTLYSLYPDLRGYSEAELLDYFEIQTLEALHQHLQNIQKNHAPQLDNGELQGSSLCNCTDSKGQPKDLYETEAYAHREINAIMVHAKTKLSVYPCPSGCGWHLTKR